MCGLSAKNQDSPDSLLLSFLAGGGGGGALASYRPARGIAVAEFHLVLLKLESFCKCRDLY